MKYIICVFTIFCFSFSLSGQSTPAKQGSLNEGSIDAQYDFLLKKSNNYQQYKVVRKDFLNKFYGNVADSLVSYNKEIASLNNTIELQKENVQSLTENVNTLETDLAQVNKEKDSFSLFGILLSKNTYNTVMWSLILALLGGLLLYIYRFNRSHAVTAKAKETLAKTKEDFDAYRKKTLEKEQKLMRKLQDELNKNAMNVG